MEHKITIDNIKKIYKLCRDGSLEDVLEFIDTVALSQIEACYIYCFSYKFGLQDELPQYINGVHIDPLPGELVYMYRAFSWAGQWRKLLAERMVAYSAEYADPLVIQCSIKFGLSLEIHIVPELMTWAIHRGASITADRLCLKGLVPFVLQMAQVKSPAILLRFLRDAKRHRYFLKHIKTIYIVQFIQSNIIKQMKPAQLRYIIKHHAAFLRERFSGSVSISTILHSVAPEKFTIPTKKAAKSILQKVIDFSY